MALNTKELLPRSEMTILIAPDTVNHFLRLACIILDTIGGSTLDEALPMARWYEDLEMMVHAT